MKTNVINTASENVTSFVINEDMLNEKKAIKYISKPNMVAAINEICAAIKGLNSKFAPQEYTEANSKKELFDAYGRFYSSILTSRTSRLRLVTVLKKRLNVLHSRLACLANVARPLW